MKCLFQILVIQERPLRKLDIYTLLLKLKNISLIDENMKLKIQNKIIEKVRVSVVIKCSRIRLVWVSSDKRQNAFQKTASRMCFRLYIQKFWFYINNDFMLVTGYEHITIDINKQKLPLKSEWITVSLYPF